MPTLRFTTEGDKEAAAGVKSIADNYARLNKEIAATPRTPLADRSAGVSENTRFQQEITRQKEALDDTAVSMGAYNSTLSKAGSLVSAFDSNLGSAISTVAGASEALQSVKGGFSEVAPAGLAAGAAMVALTAALYAVQAAGKNNAETNQKYIDALDAFGAKERKIREYALNASDEYLASEQERLDAERQILEAQIANNEKAIKSVNDQLGIAKGFADVFGVDTDEAEKNLDKLKKQLKEVNDSVSALNSEEVQRANAIRNEISAMQQEYDIREQIIGQIDNLSEAQVNQIIRSKELLLALKEEEKQALQTELAKETYKNVPEADANLLGLEAFAVQTDASRLLADSLNEATAETEKLQKEIDLYREIALPAAKANDELKASTENLKKAQDALKSTQDELASLAEKRKNVEEQIASNRIAENTQKIRDYITGTLEKRIEEAKAAEALAAKEQQLIQIREQASQQTAQIRRDLNAELNNLERDYLASRQDLINEYYANSLEALQDYQITERRAVEDYNTQRLRQIEDLYGNLSDAALDNDIKRFIEIQKEGEKNLRRNAEDQDTETRRRAEDFARQQAQARAQFEQQLQESAIQYEIERKEREKQALIRIQEIEAQARKEIELARQAGQVKLSESQRLEQQLNAIRQSFRQADEQQARQVRIQNMQIELQDIQQQEQAILEIRRQAFIDLSNSLMSYFPQRPAPVPTSGSATVPPINVNLGGVNVGEIATPSQVNRDITALADAILGALRNVQTQLAGR